MEVCRKAIKGQGTMATKTWNGSDGLFSLDGNWTPQAAPASGDIASIGAGTVTATGALPGSLVIALSSSNASSPVLLLSGATLAASSQLSLIAGGTNATLRIRGAVNNQGTITASGTSPGVAFFEIDDALDGGATKFVNAGSIQVSDASFQVVTAGQNVADQLENDGLISIRSPGQTPQLAYVAANLTGTGTVLLGGGVTFEAVRAVSAGQTFVFERSIGGATTLRMDAGRLFEGAISGFTSSDTIQLVSSRWDQAAYVSTNASSGVLNLALGGTIVKSISFKGSYTTDSFKLQETTPAGNSQASTTVVVNDPLFDTAYYLSQNPDVAAAGVDPYQQFMTLGWKQGRNPNSLFDVSYYRSQNADVAAAALNPLSHFEQYGWKDGRQPSLLFSDSKYLAANPDVKAASLDPLRHYEQYGKAEGRATFLTGSTTTADTLIDTAFYDKQLGATLIPAGAAGQQQAAWSYDTSGWRQGLNPDAFFDSKYYLAHNPDVKAAGVDPLKHFEQYGWREGRDPSLLFSDGKYLAANPDVKKAALDPLLHYIQYGQKEGRITFLTGNTAMADPLVNAAYYDKQLGATLVPAGVAAQQQAASSYDTTGWRQGLNPDAFFDTKYYLSHNPDVAAAKLNPVKHYEQYGWHEGRNPSALFSTAKYLAAYSDVRAAKLDPLEHFLTYGQAEGRTAFAV